MAGRWTDDHQGHWRARDDEPFYYGQDRGYGREERSWERERPDMYAARRGGPSRDRVFGERESGASYGRAGGGPASGYQRDAQSRSSQRFGSQDYTQGGRFYGDDSRERVYREEYGQGGVEYGDEPRGYDADSGYSTSRARYHASGYGEPGYGDYPEPSRRRASGGTGGYDYERGYGDGGRGDARRDREPDRNAERWEDAGRGAGQFLHRAGERMASWFGGGGEARAYHPGYDRQDPGHRGRGPQGYKRADERISDDAHERLTDDTWLDASHIAVSVSAGEVTLTGAVDNREAKHRAERIVEDIPGVTHVQNNLRVAKGGFFTSAGPGYGDSVLGAQIREEGPPEANGTGGAGGGQSTAGRKN
jgi:hypothetical protein